MPDLSVGVLGAKNIPTIVDGLEVMVFGAFPVVAGQYVPEVILVGLQNRMEIRTSVDDSEPPEAKKKTVRS